MLLGGGESGKAAATVLPKPDGGTSAAIIVRTLVGAVTSLKAEHTNRRPGASSISTLQDPELRLRRRNSASACRASRGRLAAGTGRCKFAGLTRRRRRAMIERLTILPPYSGNQRWLALSQRPAATRYAPAPPARRGAELGRSRWSCGTWSRTAPARPDAAPAAPVHQHRQAGVDAAGDRGVAPRAEHRRGAGVRVDRREIRRASGGRCRAPPAAASAGRTRTAASAKSRSAPPNTSAQNLKRLSTSGKNGSSSSVVRRFSKSSSAREPPGGADAAEERRRALVRRDARGHQQPHDAVRRAPAARARSTNSA